MTASSTMVNTSTAMSSDGILALTSQHPLSTMSAEDNLETSSPSKSKFQTTKSSNSMDRTLLQKYIVAQSTNSSFNVSVTVLKDVSTTLKSVDILPTSQSTIKASDNSSITVQAQIYADSPLSNLPVYIAIGIVVLSFACILHLVYR